MALLNGTARTANCTLTADSANGQHEAPTVRKASKLSRGTKGAAISNGTTTTGKQKQSGEVDLLCVLCDDTSVWPLPQSQSVLAARCNNVHCLLESFVNTRIPYKRKDPMMSVRPSYYSTHKTP